MALAQDKEKLKNAWLYEAESEFKQVLRHCLNLLVVCVCVDLGGGCFINNAIIVSCSVERKIWLCHHQRLRLWSV